MIKQTQTQVLKLSDAVIKRCAGDKNIRQLRDLKLPLVYRFKGDRSRGSWFVVRHVHNRTHWLKVGNFPGLTTRALVKRLPDLLATLALDDQAQHLSLSSWSVLGELLSWYGERVAKDRNLSKRRKVSIKSVLHCHLVPILATAKLRELDHQYIDQQLIWPLQQHYALSTVKLILAVLKGATKQATLLQHIDIDPLAALKFGDFINAKIQPKPSALTGEAGRQVIDSLRLQEIEPQSLVLLMLMHATRIGETRLSKWRDFDLQAKRWTIPESSTKTSSHTLPLTDQALVILNRHKQQQLKRGYTGVYLFPGSAQGKAVSSSKANQWINQVSKGQWTSHDLRKLTRSNLVELGVDHWVGERILNHALPMLDQTYIFSHADQLMRDALNRYHLELLDQGLSFFVAETDPRPTVSLIEVKTSNHQ